MSWDCCQLTVTAGMSQSDLPHTACLCVWCCKLKDTSNQASCLGRPWQLQTRDSKMVLESSLLCGERQASRLWPSKLQSADIGLTQECMSCLAYCLTRALHGMQRIGSDRCKVLALAWQDTYASSLGCQQLTYCWRLHRQQAASNQCCSFARSGRQGTFASSLAVICYSLNFSWAWLQKFTSSALLSWPDLA